jgi:hypothetical protein
MDPEKNQLSTNSSPPAIHSPRLKKRLLKVFLYTASAVGFLLAFHSLAQHDRLTANSDSPLQQVQDDKHGRHRLTMKMREQLFLYVIDNQR